MRRVLLAPDAFKGTFSAVEVCSLIAEGIKRAGDEPIALPAADGGEGTLAVLLGALGGKLRRYTIADPLGRKILASWGLTVDRSIAIVETAAASGLHLISPSPATAERASSAGTGQLIAVAAAAGVGDILVGVGGSATTDGGSGAIEAIFEAGGLGQAKLTVLCDVTTPFEHAAEVFGPQKGADPATVHRLTRRLDDIGESLPRDPRGLPMTGAGGGLAGGLWATFGACLVPGAATVLNMIGFDAAAAKADVVVTGEGRLDSQSLQGKLASEVASRGRQAGRPVHAVVGSLDGDPSTHSAFSSVTVASTTDDLRAAWSQIRGR